MVKLRDTVTGAERTLTEEAYDPEVTAWKWTEGTHGCDCERLNVFYPEPHDFPSHVLLDENDADWPACVQADPGGFLVKVVSVTVGGVEVVRHNAMTADLLDE